MDINVVASGGFPWSPLEHRGVENSTRINDLRCLLDFLRIPWNDAVERVKGIEPSYEAWEAAVLPLNYTRSGVVPRRRARAEPTIIARLFSDSRGIFMLAGGHARAPALNASPI